MKLFLQKLFLFSLFLAILLCLSAYFLGKLVNKKEYYSIDKNLTSLLLGHSRTECAYDTKYMKGFVNLGQSAEPYFFTFIKMRKILEANPQIRFIFVEFSENYLQEKFMSDWTYGDDFFDYHFSRFGHIMNISEVRYLFKHNPTAVLKALPLSLRNCYEFSINKSNSFIEFAELGGFQSHSGSFIDSLNRINSQKVKELISKSDDIVLAEDNLAYLDSIVSYAKRCGVNVCLLRSPIYPTYKNAITERFFDSVYKNRFSSISLIDLSNFRLPDSAYLDYHHLNKFGAAKVSDRLSKVVANELNMNVTNFFTIHSRVQIFY